MAILGTLLCWQTASAGQEWQWGITPYLWGSSIELDATVNDAAVGGKVEFSDLIDKLDAALQVHIEGHSSGPWGVFGDFTYISISDDSTAASGALIDNETDTLIVEAGGVYAVAEGIDLLFGVRNLDIESDTRVTPPGAEISMNPSILDGLIGVRFTGAMSDRWDYILRLDVATGDSNITKNAVAAASLHYGKKGNKRVLFGYRHMDIETDPEGSSEVEADLIMSGPIIGFEFTFGGAE
jgi:hypothetical protein